MTQRFIVILTLLFLTAFVYPAFSAYHHMGEMDSDNFIQAYPDKAGTKLDSCALCHNGGKYEKEPGVWVSMGSCQWCHYSYGYDKSGIIDDTLNPYGIRYLIGGRTSQTLKAIETLDSDDDGYSNIDEIQAERFPGNSNDDPTKKTAPFRVYTREQLEKLPQHTQFLLMNTSKSGDFYAQYSGVTVENLLLDAGILSNSTGITVFAPDAWSQYHPLNFDENPEIYHVSGIYPQATYQYNPDVDWCDYSAPSCAERNHDDTIKVEGGLQMLLATKRDGKNLVPGMLTSDNKLKGEGPYRIIIPQKTPSPPDQASNSENQDVLWPYTENWDHNAGACTRSVTIIRVDPLPEGTTDIDVLEAGWDYIDQEKIIVYGAIAAHNTDIDMLKYKEIQAVDTQKARSWESFAIYGTTYLAAANQVAPSNIYKWNKSFFEKIQSIDIEWAETWKSFVINKETYLALALSRQDKNTCIAYSPIFKWDGKKFQKYQKIKTMGARDIESFVINGETYLAIANGQNDETRNVDSKIYKWKNIKFVEIQAIPTNGARDLESFVIDGKTYLAVANQDNDKTRSIYSQIYQWNGTQFIEIQKILTNSAQDWKSFKINSQTFLAVANNQSNGSRSTASKIYKWNGTSFMEIQSILTHGAYDWESFTIGSAAYLIVANNKNNTTPSIDSKIYKWDGTSFSEVSSIATQGIRDWEPFVMNNEVYLIAANDDEEYPDTKNIFSKIYKIQKSGDDTDNTDTDKPDKTDDTTDNTEKDTDDGGSCFISTIFN